MSRGRYKQVEMPRRRYNSLLGDALVGGLLVYGGYKVYQHYKKKKVKK